MPTPPYQKPTFKQRAEMAAEAKQAALDKLRAKTPVDPAIVESRRIARAAREAEEASKRADKRSTWELEKALRKARAQELRQLEVQPDMTEAERKAARDARYSRRRGRHSM